MSKRKTDEISPPESPDSACIQEMWAEMVALEEEAAKKEQEEAAKKEQEEAAKKAEEETAEDPWDPWLDKLQAYLDMLGITEEKQVEKVVEGLLVEALREMNKRV